MFITSRSVVATQPKHLMAKRKIAPMGLNFQAAQRPLIEALLLANEGDALIEASEEMKAVVHAVREHGGKVIFMLLCPGLESLLRDQVLAVELRLREWIKARAAESADWEKALIVRAAVALLPPAPLTSGMR